VGWGGASILGIVNGAIRELAYKDRLGEQQANQLSALTLVSLRGSGGARLPRNRALVPASRLSSAAVRRENGRIAEGVRASGVVGVSCRTA
jgi:hypothetical protein